MNDEIEDLKGKITIAGVNSLSPSSVDIRITVLTAPMKQASVQRILLKEIKETFDKNKIVIPYPQMVLHNG